MYNPSKDAAIALNTAATATGTTAVNSTHVDMLQEKAVAFLLSLGTPNAGNNIKVQGGNASDDSDMADLAGSKVTPTGTGPSAVIVDVVRPPYRYVRLVTTRAGATTIIGDIWTVQYDPSKPRPIDNTGAAAFVNLLVDPVAGTA